MGKVGRFITDPKAGAYCQVTLDSGDKLIVNHARGGFKGGPLTMETTKWWGGGQQIVTIDLDSAAGKAAKNSGRPRLPDDQVTPIALYQRERRARLKASRTTQKH